jgi:LCP family protein required for cell wall assembly
VPSLHPDAQPPDDQPRRVDPYAPLPPELDPRGRRRARRAANAGFGVAEPGMGGGGGRGRHRVRNRVVLVVMIVAGLLAASVVVVSGWAWWTYRDFNTKISRVDALNGSGKPTKDIDGKDQNILIAGNDDRDTATDAELAQLGTTRDGGSLNTDTMMLVHVPANGAKATVISFPRDSYVAIPGFSSNKLNSAYPDGYTSANGATAAKRSAGARLLVHTLQDLTGLTFDHFVQVDLLGFYRISNAIGGVPVVLCQAQHEANSGINLPAGRSVIKGKQALAFVRQRYGLPNGDFDRIKRQQYFLSAAFRQITSAGTLLNPFKLKSLLNAVDRSLQMDPTLDPLALAQQMQSLTADNITFKTIPTDGLGSNDAGSVVLVNPAEVRQFVQGLIKPSTPAPASTVRPSTVTVDVLNGSSVAGAATASASVLKAAGFVIGRVDTTANTDSTVIEYPSGKQGQATTVAAHVPNATLRPDNSVSHVTLVLGANGVTAKIANLQLQAAPARAAVIAPAAAPIDAGCIN